MARKKHTAPEKQIAQVGNETDGGMAGPMRAPVFDLAALVAGITNENRHTEIGLGGPVSNERC